VVICMERGADLHTAQLMPLPLTLSCFSEIRIGFTFLVPAHPGSPDKGPLNVCVCVCVCVCVSCNSSISMSLQWTECSAMILMMSSESTRHSYSFNSTNSHSSFASRNGTASQQHNNNNSYLASQGRLGSRVVSVLDSGAELGLG